MLRVALALLLIGLPRTLRAESSYRPRPRWLTMLLFDMNSGLDFDRDRFRAVHIPDDADPRDLAFLVDTLTDAVFAGRPLSETAIDKIADIGMNYPALALPAFTDIASRVKDAALRRSALAWFDRVFLLNDKASASEKSAAMDVLIASVAGDLEPENRMEAVRMLEFHKEPQAIAALVRAVREDPVVRVKVEAALALDYSHIKDDSVPELEAKLRADVLGATAERGARRVELIHELCRLDLPTDRFGSLQPLLLEIIADESDFDARVAANACLQNAGDKAAPTVTQLQRILDGEKTEYLRLQMQRTVDGILHPEQFYNEGPL